MRAIDFAIGVAVAFATFVVVWRKRETFPYLLVGFLGLEYFGAGESPITLPKIGFAALAFMQLVLGRWRIRFCSASIMPALLIFIGYFAVSFLWSVDPGRALVRTTTLVALVMACSLVAGSIQSSDDIHAFLRALVLYGAANAITAVVQISRGIMVYDEFVGGRVGGLGVNPTEGAFYLSIALLITIGYHLEPSHAKGWLSAASVRIGLMTLLPVGLLLTGSRGGALAFLAALGVLGFAKRRPGALRRGEVVVRLGIIALFVGAIVFSMAGARQMFSDRIALAREDEFGNRFAIWERVANSIAERPILGSGLNSASIATGTHDESFTYSTHNVALTALLDGGAVGFIFLLFVAWRVLWAVGCLRRSRSHVIAFLGMHFSVVLVCTAVNMMGHDLGFNKLLWVVFGLIESALALNILADRTAKPTGPSGPSRFGPSALPRHAKA